MPTLPRNGKLSKDKSIRHCIFKYGKATYQARATYKPGDQPQSLFTQRRAVYEAKHY